jgi:hypothetical protein
MSDSDDTTPAAWLDALPEQLRSAPFIGKAADMDDALGKLAHAAQYMGQAIKKPAHDASQEDMDAFYAKFNDVPGMAILPGLDDIDAQVALLEKLGAPTEATGYDLPALEQFEWDEDIGSDLKKYAKEAGMTKAQFNKFATLIGTQEQQVASTSTTEREASRKELRDTWGEALTEREDMIRGWMDKSNAPEEMVELLNDKNLPLPTMEWLLSVAGQFKSDVTPISKDGPNHTPALAPTQARARIDEILRHPAYFDAASPLHKDMVNEMLKMQGLANPAQSA